MIEAMLDLETLSLSCDAPLLQVGACLFSLDTRTLYGSSFDMDVNVASCVSRGARVELETAGWWASRGGFKPKGEMHNIEVVLNRLASWINQVGDVNVWTKGPSFDIAILEWWYKRLGMDVPWAFYRARDVRTIEDLAKRLGWQVPSNLSDEPPHDAYLDAVLQARRVTSAWAFLESRR